jgi:hypothetical protein
MKMILALAFCATSFLAIGCGKSPCDELSDQCAKCTDAQLKSSCQSAASSYSSIPITGQDACQALLDQKVYASCGN